MKSAGWWCLLSLLGMALPVWAQQEYIYVTGNGDSSVTVLKQAVPPTSAPIVQKTIFDPTIATPFDILYDAGRHRLYVSNTGASPGTIAVIDATTTKVLLPIPVLASQNLLGMALSDDGNFLYVAGQLVTLPGPVITPAVFEINLTVANPQGTALANPSAVAGDAATSVVVIPAHVAGGSGNGPGRIYYTVPQLPNGPGYIGISYKVGAGPNNFAVGPLSPTSTHVTLPTRMARSPDGTIVFAVCTASDAFLRLVRIDAVANTSAEASIGAALASGQVSHDVSFRPETAVQTAYVWLSNATSGEMVFQVDSTGASLNSIVPGQAFALGSLRHHLDPSGNDFIYLGDNGGSPFGRINAAGGTMVTMNPGGAGKGALYFAFAPMPAAPKLIDVAPKGQVQAANLPILLKGQNFLPGATVTVSSTPPDSTNVVSPSEIDLMVSGITAGAGTVVVTNPDLQVTSLQTYYVSCPQPPVNFPLTLPSRSQGYSLFSVPQYTMLDQVRQAFQAALGPYNPMVYRVFFWDADHYEELNQIGSDPQDMSGRAFWVITRDGGSVTIPGFDCLANGAGAPRVVPLTPGWNLISNPFVNGALVHENWNAVSVTTDGSNLASAVLTNSAAAAFIIDPTLWQFTANGYQTTGVLVAGSGYWVNNISGGPAYLVFQPGNLFKLVGPPPAGGGGGSPPPGPPGAALGSSTSGTNCALLGPELLLLGLAFHRRWRRRRLGA